MKVRYNKLWKLLIDKGMKKSQLREAVGVEVLDKERLNRIARGEA